MKDLVANCPPYLLILGSFSLIVAGGLYKLYGMLQLIGLGQ